MIGLNIFFLRRNLKRKLKRIKLIVSDVDGVLTKGEIGYSDNISGLKLFNVKDGLAVKLLKSNGIKVAFISGGDSEATVIRAKALCVDQCYTNIEEKDITLLQIQEKLGISTDETLYIGDDINDLDVLPYVALFVAPNDSNYLVNKEADLKLKTNGGNGVLREICDIILKIKIINTKNLIKKKLFS